MNLGLGSTLLPGDPRLIDHIVGEVKSQGIFDQFRKECIADVDTKPAYQNLRTRVESSVNSFLSKQRWRADLNKNQLRETLRKHISDGPYLDTGVERIVAQVVNPKIYSVFMPQIEDVVYTFLGLEKPMRERNGACGFKDLLPKDLDPVSPESDKNSLKDVSLDSVDANLTVPGEEEEEEEEEEQKPKIKDEPKEPEIKEEIQTEETSQNNGEFSSEKINPEIGKSMAKPMDLESSTPPPPPGVDNEIVTTEKVTDEGEEEDEDEEDSPVFEPIDIMNLNDSYISNDSHLSGISELTSHRSRSPDFSNEFSRDNFDFSNQDSQLSKVSSDSRLSIVTDFGYSNQPTTPTSEVIKDDNSKEKFVKDNFKEIRDESDKISELKTIDMNKQKDNIMDIKDSSDTRSSRTNSSLKESSRDDTEFIRDKSEHKEREKHRETVKSKDSKERSESRDSKSHKDRDKRKSNQSDSKSDNSDKSKAKEKSEIPKDTSEKSRESIESKESKESLTKNKEDKPKESSGKDSKDLKAIYKEKIRELREKKELTEKERMNKDNKESKEPTKDSKVSKDSKDKRESSKDKDKHRSSSSSSRHRSSSRHGSKSSRSSKDDGKTSRSESRDKSKRDDRRHSKDGKSKSQSESVEKSDIKKVSKSERDEKPEIKQDVKSREKSSKKDSKSESNKSTEKTEKRDDSKEKKRKDEKKSKSKDDHSSLRKNSNDRRSSDRDGSSGSNGKSSHKSSSSSSASSKQSSTPLEKESNNTSNSSSETSDSIDESQTEDYIINEPEIKEEKTEAVIENIHELSDDNSIPKRIDLGPTEISLPLKKRPLQKDESAAFANEMTVKKPKFARNFEEAKKLMKLRKKLEKFKDQGSGDSRSSVSSEISETSEVENDGISSVPDDERVQIVAIKDDEEDVPYPEMECNFITDDTSKIILGDTELLNKEIITKLNTKSTLSEMELSIRQSLNEMISGKNLEDNAPQNVLSSDSDSRPCISNKDANSLDEQPKTDVNDIPESIQPPIRDRTKEDDETKQKPAENHTTGERPIGTLLEEEEPKQNISTEKFKTTAPYSSPQNPQLSEDEEDCLYFLPDYERLNRFTQFLNSLDEAETSSILLEPLEKSPRESKHSEISTMAPPQPKRKYSTSPLSDILLNNSNNNNDGPKIQPTIYEEDGQTAVKKTKIARQKKQRASVSSLSPKNLINGENFVMPLSPESDASVTSEKNQITQNPDKNRPRGSNQRYTSDDLYKPRPLFASSSRRSRRSNPS